MKELSGPIELIKRSINIFFEKKNLIYFLKIYAMLLPFLILSLLQGKFVTNPSDFFGKYLWLVPVVLILGLSYLIISFWVSASGIIGVINAVDNENLSVKKTLVSSWKILWEYSLLQIVIGFMIAVGFIFLIVPGVLFAVWFHFSSFIFVKDRPGVKLSVLGSKKLTSGRFWKVFGRVLVFGLFSLLIQILLSVLPFRLGSVIYPIFGALFILPSYLLFIELKGK